MKAAVVPHSKRWSILLTLLLFLFLLVSPQLFAQDGLEGAPPEVQEVQEVPAEISEVAPVPPPLINPGRPVAGVVDLASGIPYVSYRFIVPEDAVRASVVIDSAPGDLDLYVRYGTEILDYAEVDAEAVSDAFNESLVLYRFGEVRMAPGEYYLDVVYQREEAPRADGRPLDRIPFNLTVNYQRARPHETIQAGEKVSAVLKPEEGMMKLFAVKTGQWDTALRIDIADTTGDVDIFVAYENPLVGPGNADISTESLLGREALVIGRGSYPPLQGGTYYVLVADQVSDKFPVLFTMHTSSEPDPPAELLALPPIPDPDEPLAHAIGATVEVVGSEGRGSGCVVSEDGYILTNWHVVRDGENRPSDPVYVAFTLNQRIPPKELFSGTVERYDEALDLALIKIDAGRYGQPVPSTYRFPYFRMGDADDLRIGQPISILGYPANGGIGSRVSITLTRGVISGFEASPLGTYLKTDAKISFGNSGGAVFDAFGELLGLPVSISDDGKLGFILPVTMIPPSWLKIIDGSH